VTNANTETAYGSTYDTSGVTVLVSYSDGTSATVSPDWISLVDTSRIGAQVVTVSYQGVQTTFTLSVVPRAVSNVKRKASTADSVTITWDSLEESKSYNIYTSTSVNGTYTKAGSATGTEYTFINMVQGKVIYVCVQAVSDEILGEYSEVIAIAPKPDKVTGVKSIKNVKTKVTLQWEAAKGATGYAIYYRRTDSTSTSYVLSGYTTELTYQVQNLTAGKDYYFIVYAYAATEDNMGEGSDAVLYGTAPSIPSITKLKGGDKRVKVYWKKGSGADTFRIYVSTNSSSGFTLMATITGDGYKIAAVDGLKNKKKYYVKVEAVRTVSGIEMTSVSTVSSATTKKAKATSTKAKLYKTKAKLKKSAAYKKYKEFRKVLSYKKSYIVPGTISTNVAGFTAARMVPQSITFAEKYLLVSAYDYTKAQESVIYIMDKATGKYLTTIVMPHTGHLGGIAYDGTNIWITHGKKVECFPYRIVTEAVDSGAAYVELYQFTSVCAMPETVSYLSYYKGKLWAGAYSETQKKYMYGYTINDKNGVPSLTRTNRILMPNRTQGVTFTSGGKMIVSRSCQTKAGRSGFMSQLETYKPTWDLSKTTIKKNKRKKVVKMPPMNEGIAISGSYTYVIYESSAFSECEAPLDRITAFKTSKIS
jgi:hypothetical protein